MMTQPKYIQNILDRHSAEGLPHDLRTDDPIYDAALKMVTRHPDFANQAAGEGKQIKIVIPELQGLSAKKPQPEDAREELGVVADAVYELLAKRNIKFVDLRKNFSDHKATSELAHAHQSVSYRSDHISYTKEHRPGEALVYIHLANDDERKKAVEVLKALAVHNNGMKIGV